MLITVNCWLLTVEVLLTDEAAGRHPWTKALISYFKSCRTRLPGVNFWLQILAAELVKWCVYRVHILFRHEQDGRAQMRRILDKVRQLSGILKFQSSPPWISCRISKLFPAHGRLSIKNWQHAFFFYFLSQVGGWPVLEGSKWVEKDWLVFD